MKLPVHDVYDVAFAGPDAPQLQRDMVDKILNAMRGTKRLCKSDSINVTRGVSEEYMTGYALNPARPDGKKPYTHLGLLYRTVSKKTGSVSTVACVVLAATGDDLFLDVLCAWKPAASSPHPRYGQRMMLATLAYARAQGFRTMSLNALKHVVDLYPRFWFKAGRMDPCSPGHVAERVQGSSEGYRFRKCLVDASPNYVPESEIPDSHRLPPLGARAHTERTSIRHIDLTNTVSGRGRASRRQPRRVANLVDLTSPAVSGSVSVSASRASRNDATRASRNDATSKPHANFPKDYVNLTANSNNNNSRKARRRL
jgi:hypothetical protein